MGRGGLYFLTRRPGLDERSIGAFAVEPCPSTGVPGVMAVKRRGRRLLIPSDRLAATDGQIVREPAAPLAVPELLDKGTIRTILRGLAPAPDFILLWPGLRKTRRVVRLRGSSVGGALRFLLRHKSAYLKPAGATGSGAFVIRLSRAGETILPESSDRRIGDLKPFPSSVGGLRRFLSKVRREIQSHGKTPYLIMESEIPALKLRGRNVDLRFLVQRRAGRLECTASYAKVGSDGITANIGTGGRGREMGKTIRALGGSATVSRKLLRRMRALALMLVRTLFAKLRCPPPLAAADFVLVERGGRLVPFLMEVNQGPVCFSGLKSADPRSYRRAMRTHERNLATAVSEFRRKSSEQSG